MLNNMDIKLTPRGKHLIEKVKSFAKDLNHSEVTLNHLFAVCLFCEDVKTLMNLKKSGLDVENLRKYLSESFFKYSEKKVETVILDSDCNDLLVHAQAFSDECDDGYVSIDHIFLMLVDQVELLDPDINKMISFDQVLFENEMASFFGGQTFLSEPAEVNEVEYLNFKSLSEHGSDLTAECVGEENDIQFRDYELEKIEHIINQKKKSNVLIVGESGVGKTSIIKCLAHRIANNKCGHFTRGRIIFSFDMGSLLSGTKYRGDFEQKIKEIAEEAKNTPVILFIDEIHNIVGTGDYEGSLDAANILIPYLSSGQITLIGATTFKDYRNKISKNKRLDRLFEQVIVKEPSTSETLKILKTKKKEFEDFHLISISDKNLEDIIDLSEKYLKKSHFPDKAFSLLDTACSIAKNKTIKKPKKIEELEKTLISQAQKGVPQELFEEYTKECEEWATSSTNNKPALGYDFIISALSDKINIPKDKFNETETKKYETLPDRIKEKVIGQDEAVEEVCRSLYRYKTGFRNPNQPISCFAFLGKTGRGKTFLAKTLANEFFVGKGGFIRLDMSEYAEKQSISKMIGAPAGYVGHEEGGGLIEKVSQNPYSVILFDEIEKAHPEVHKILLQVMEEGELTDSIGRKACFKNAIIILTGNVGSSILAKKAVIGFNGKIEDKDKHGEAFKELKKVFPLELIGRIDKVVFFNDFSNENIKKIIKNELDSFLGNSQYKVSYNNKILDHIYSKNKESEFGARQLKNVIQTEVLDPLSYFCLKNKPKNVFMGYSKKKITFKEKKCNK